MGGQWPSIRHDNQPFSASTRIGDKKRNAKFGPLKTRSCMLRMTGDWQWLKQGLGLQGWGDDASLRVCWKCDATTDDLANAGLDAHWRSLSVTKASFLERKLAAGVIISGVFNLPGFLLEYCLADWMRAVDLGIAQIVTACILWELFKMMGGTREDDEPLQNLCVMLRQMSKQLNIDPPFWRCTLNMVRVVGKSPRMKLKAAETRRLVPCLVRLLELIFPPQNAKEIARLECLRFLDLCYKEAESWGEGSPFRLARYGRCHVALYRDLWSAAHGWVLYRFYPKHHLFIHICERGTNPRDEWCYRDESTIADVVQVAEHQNTQCLHRTIIQKHRLHAFKER